MRNVASRVNADDGNGSTRSRRPKVCHLPFEPLNPDCHVRVLRHNFFPVCLQFFPNGMQQTRAAEQPEQKFVRLNQRIHLRLTPSPKKLYV